MFGHSTEWNVKNTPPNKNIGQGMQGAMPKEKQFLAVLKWFNVSVNFS